VYTSPDEAEDIEETKWFSVVAEGIILSAVKVPLGAVPAFGVTVTALLFHAALSTCSEYKTRFVLASSINNPSRLPISLCWSVNTS
jgi:hypothetical protein